MTTVCKPFSKPLQSARRVVAKVVRGERKMGGEESKYWGMWREIARKFGWSNAQKEEMRRELTLEIFGTHKSHKVFSHGDYDVVFGAMRELLAQSQLAIFPEKIIWAYMEGDSPATAIPISCIFSMGAMRRDTISISGRRSSTKTLSGPSNRPATYSTVRPPGNSGRCFLGAVRRTV